MISQFYHAHVADVGVAADFVEAEYEFGVGGGRFRHGGFLRGVVVGSATIVAGG